MAHGNRETLKPLFGWRAAVSESDLPPTTKHVALALSLYMNEMGGSCHPGAVTLAKNTGIHVSTVRERLNDLVTHGFLTIVEQGGRRGERRRANAYEASIPHPQLIVSDDPSPKTTRRARRTDPSPQAAAPLVSDDPISTEISPVNSSTPTPLPPAARVFAHWQEVTGHKRAVLDAKRKKRVAWALKNYPLEDVLDAISGVKVSPFHCGQNDSGAVYDDLELILRDAKHIEQFRTVYRDGAPLPISQSTRLAMGLR